jgi:Tfp pilus assembly protein PilO
MKKTPNLKILVAVTAVVLIGGLGAAFFQYSSLADVQMRVEALRQKATAEKALAKQAQETTDKVKECSERLAHLEQSVPKTAYVPTLLKEIEAVGKQNGIDVVGVRPIVVVDNIAKKDDKADKKAKKAYDELRIEVKGRGNYASVLKFVESLKDFPKIVAVRTFTMAPKVETNRKGSSNLDLTIELKTYVFSEDTPNREAKNAETEVPVKNG